PFRYGLLRPNAPHSSPSDSCNCSAPPLSSLGCQDLGNDKVRTHPTSLSKAPRARRSTNDQSGDDGSGNTPSAAKKNSQGCVIMFITTPSHMATLVVLMLSPIHHSTDSSMRSSIPQIGSVYVRETPALDQISMTMMTSLVNS